MADVAKFSGIPAATIKRLALAYALANWFGFHKLNGVITVSAELPNEGEAFRGANGLKFVLDRSQE